MSNVVPFPKPSISPEPSRPALWDKLNTAFNALKNADQVQDADAKADALANFRATLGRINNKTD
jgi:hypothetical protein